MACCKHGIHNQEPAAKKVDPADVLLMLVAMVLTGCFAFVCICIEAAVMQLLVNAILRAMCINQSVSFEAMAVVGILAIVRASIVKW